MLCRYVHCKCNHFVFDSLKFWTVFSCCYRRFVSGGGIITSKIDVFLSLALSVCVCACMCLRHQFRFTMCGVCFCCVVSFYLVYFHLFDSSTVHTHTNIVSSNIINFERNHCEWCGKSDHDVHMLFSQWSKMNWFKSRWFCWIGIFI